MSPLNIYNSSIVRYTWWWMASLMLLAIIGFWPTYFSQLFGPGGFNGYFHFHAAMATLWIIILIIQPVLIRTKRYALHRRIGTIAHIVLALFFLSVILLTHHQLSSAESIRYVSAFIPCRDLVIVGVAYTIAMRYDQVIGIHARGMIATGIAFIEPSLIRAISSVFPDLDHKYYWTIGITYVIIMLLIIIGRKQKPGRWVFPLILGIYIVAHVIIIRRLPLGYFEDAVDWFVSLPIT